MADSFSDKAGSAYVAKVDREGSVTQEKATVTVAAGTTTTDTIYMHRFQKGFALYGFQLASDDLDTGTTLTLAVGYEYDSSSLTSDDNAFLTNSDIAQDAGSIVYPTADGLLTATTFTAEGDGYITITPSAGTTISSGDIVMRTLFSYDE